MRILWQLLLVLAWAGDPPGFEQYAVSGRFTGKPVTPVLRTKHQRQFRSRLRESAAEGPNFAGHYTVAQWGCGAGCVSLGIIDAANGNVFDQEPAYFTLDARSAMEPVQFRISSRLLILDGCPLERDCGLHYYAWDGKKLQKVASTMR